MGRQKEKPPVEKKPPIEVRRNLREQIRDRYSVGQRWKCLEEAVRSEDQRRDQFYRRIEAEANRNLPLVVRKFIRTLKRSVHSTMRKVGGTPFSIVRQMFLHWDADQTGLLNFKELNRCMLSLGVDIAHEDLQAILAYYDSGTGEAEMSYSRLLEDLQIGEPGLLHIVDQDESVEEESHLRFRTYEDEFAVKPPLIDPFIAALRSIIAVKLRNEGGTPHSHLRSAFLKHDSGHINALTVKDLVEAMTSEMGLAITED